MSALQAVSYAEEPQAPVLQLQQGTVDDTKKTPDVLNGNIEKTDVIDGNPAGEEGSLSRRQISAPPASENEQGPLFGATQQLPYRAVIINQRGEQDLSNILNNASGLFKLFLGKSAFGPVIELGKREPQLSPEEYRKMEYGVIGIDALLQLGGPGPVVTHVFPGTPAESAGLQKGDLIVKAKDHVFKPGEGQRVLWQIVAGRAGTPVDLSVLRDGEVVKFHLLRMNIEDIPDVAKRRQYEMLLSALGAPHYDADGDLTDSAQKDKNDLNNLGRFVSKKKLILDVDADDE